MAYTALNPNVSKTERVISGFTGGLMVFNSLLGHKRSIPQALVGSYLLFRGIGGFCAIYNAMGKTKPNNRSRNVNIQISMKVDRAPMEVYAVWRNFENLPLFMKHLKIVNTIDQDVSLWEAETPVGGTMRWRSEIVKEVPAQMLAWQSLPGSSIENVGKVEFEPLPNGGTLLHVAISYHAPWGIPGEGIARIFNPYFERLIREDILNFKDFLEERKKQESNTPTSDGEFLI